MEFSMRIAEQVILKEINGDKNLVLSPLSLTCMLNMVAAGSKGRTLDQLLGFLQSESVSHLNSQSIAMMEIVNMNTESSNSSQQAAPILSFVNGLWVDHRFPIKPSFESIAEDVYGAKIQAVDFVKQGKQVRNVVNSWAETATKGLIKDLLPHGCFRKDTILTLANALYFKGAWDCAFDISKTKTEDFHLDKGETVKVPYMIHLYSSNQFGSFDGFKLLQLPYKNCQDTRQFSMYLFLPDERKGLHKLIEKFNSDSGLSFECMKQLKRDKLSKIQIPKFKFSYNCEASDTIKKLGLKLPFQQMGELTEMVDSADSHLVYVSDMIHKSYIEVNEKGTEAAASTAGMRCRGRHCKRSKIVLADFVADHPFMFMIMEDKSEIILFVGAVLNPTNGEKF